MTLRVWDYRKEYTKERSTILEAVDSVFKSGRLILGSQVASFEKEFSKHVGCDYGVGVANGTDALFLALKALGVGTGDEVITVANTAVPTVSAIVSAGATPVFVDIDEHYLMDTGKVEAAISRKTKALMPVHLYGQCVNMEMICQLSQHFDLPVIEDTAQAHFATRNGKAAGSFGAFGSFSFYPSKILGAYGDGGMVVTSQESLANKLRMIRFYGMKERNLAEIHGYNSRLDEVQAAILRAKLKNSAKYVDRRREIAAAYSEELRDSGLGLPCTMAGNTHCYYLYVCRHPNRDLILKEMSKKNIELNISYPTPIHLMKAYRNLCRVSGDLTNSEQYSSEIFSLPIYPSLSNEEIDMVVTSLLEIV